MANQDGGNARAVQWNRMLEMLHRTRQGDEYSATRARELYAAEFPGEILPSRPSFVR